MFKHFSRGNLFRAGNVLQAMAWIMAMSRPAAVLAEEKNLPAPAGHATSAPASLPLYQPTATDRESLARVEVLIRQSELQSAIETLSPMIESHPTWIGALILRGHAYLRKDEMNEARESFQDAVNLDVRDRDARLGVAVACLKLKETADALESLDQLLSVHPEDGMAVVLRADALLQDGQRTVGLQYIQAILTGVKGPIKVEFLAKLIPLQLRAQDYANAESAASEWIATKPAGDAYAYRAEARRATKKLDDALADVVAGFKESAGQPGYPLLFNASQVWIDRGDAVTAICTLVDLLERVPGDDEVEKAIDRAVAVRLEQMRSAKPGGEAQLIPKIDYDSNRPAIARWELIATIGREKIRKNLSQLDQADRKSEAPLSGVYGEARTLYPAAEMYAASAYGYLTWSMEARGESLIPPVITAGWALRDFHIAAALAAVRLSRYDVEGSILSRTMEGYLEWAEFQQRIKEGKPSETDRDLLKAHAFELANDDPAALDLYRKSTLKYGAPSRYLSKRILQNPLRMKAVMTELTRQVDVAEGHKDATLLFALFDKMIEFGGTSPGGYVAKAKGHRLCNQRVEAEKALARAVDRDPFCAEARFMRVEYLEGPLKNQKAMLEYNMAARGLEKPLETDLPVVARAIAARGVLEKGFDRVALRRVYSDAADAARLEKDWATAMASASRLKFGFESPGAVVFALAGFAAEQIGRHAEAQADLQEVNRLEPARSIYGTLGDARMALENPHGAIEAYDKSIALEPEAAYAYRARGRIRLQLEEYGYAISDFKSAILKGDTSVDVLMYLAECQSFMDVNAAKETYRKIIAMPPQGLHYMGVSDSVIAQARLYLVEHPTPPRP